MPDLILNIFVLVLALVLLGQSAKWFTLSSQRVGRALGIPQFVLGVTVVAMGTSAPELFTSIFANLRDAGSVVSANVLGSNIVNILLGIGLPALFAGSYVFKKDLVRLELPMLLSVTAILVVTLYDGTFTRGEALLMLGVYAITMLASIRAKDTLLASVSTRVGSWVKMDRRDLFICVGALILLLISSKFTVDSLLNLSELLRIAPAAMAATIVALGTSLPEIAVAISAARQKNYDLALGEVIGSNIFNATVVMAVPTLFGALTVNGSILTLGLPMLIIATGLLAFSAIERKIFAHEGLLYVVLFVLFAGKLFTN
jgi:cation:H+ antiporter